MLAVESNCQEPAPAEPQWLVPRRPASASEPACEGGVSNVPADGCTGDMVAFQGLRLALDGSHRAVVSLDAGTHHARAEGTGPRRQCVGGINGRMCGTRWSSSRSDETVGVGQET